MTVSTRCAKVLTGINPQRFFGSFLIAQKGTTVPLPAPQGGTHKKGGSDLSSHPHKKSLLRAQRGNEVSHKAFLPTFFSEKSRLPVDDVFGDLPQGLGGLHVKALAAGQVGQRDDCLLYTSRCV